jgi:anti-sigma-K factor RskA
MDRNILLDLIPAYALGALDPAEQAEVERYLASDPEAQRLLADYQQVVGLLLLTVPARRAPAALVDDLRQRLKTLPSLNASVVSSAEIVRPQRRILCPAWLIPLAAAAALLILALGLLLRPTSTDPAQLYTQLASAPGSQHFTVSAPSPIGGELVAAADDRQAVLHLSQLPPLAANQTYQLWLMSDSGLRSGGLFQTSSGDTYVVVPLDESLDAYKGLAVSVEPSGGSPYPDHPSGAPILSVTVRA